MQTSQDHTNATSSSISTSSNMSNGHSSSSGGSSKGNHSSVLRILFQTWVLRAEGRAELAVSNAAVELWQEFCQLHVTSVVTVLGSKAGGTGSKVQASKL